MSENAKKVSVIVPIYNAEQCLHRCVDSILAQTYTNLEIILVDDGSSDGCPAICDEYAAKDDRIVVIHKENGGVSSARNTGLDAARGKYVGFIDADDTVTPQMFDHLLQAAEHNSADMVLGGYFRVGTDRARVPVSIGMNGLVEENPARIAYSMAFWGGTYHGAPLPFLYGSVWPNLYRTAVLRTSGIRFPTGISIGEDTLFNIDFLMHSTRISAVDEPLYVYDTSGASATRRKNEKLWESYKTLASESYALLQPFCPAPLRRELDDNYHAQVLNFAIGIIEEQLLPFYRGSELRRRIRRLCADADVKNSASHTILLNKSLKKRTQALFLRLKLTFLLEIWLKK